ncbi:MAG: DUF1345 domain-containing protein [Candidatus Sphingomonas colombiensis]|nr:DUF1345 domain-containing protein [Sphingomonas sp.]WEK44258.1 MAG: DUF1345 domain-containing protein [Sphingomonas sp.]
MTRQNHGWQIGRRIAPPRFIAFMAIMAAVWIGVGMVKGFAWGRAMMIGFDAGALFFLVSLWPLFNDDTGEVRARAKANDTNRAGLLAITALVTIVILVVVANELMAQPSGRAIVLVVATLVLAWLFSNVVYALHYAHLFYSEQEGKDAGGIDFPGEDEPHYWDFIYFSFTLGMTFQTSDVNIKSRRIRRVVIGQCLAAFVFNIGVLAFTINVLGSAGGH